MASQEPDLERGTPFLPPPQTLADNPALTTTAPTTTQYAPPDSRPLSINPYPSGPVEAGPPEARPLETSINSGMTFNQDAALVKFQRHLGIHQSEDLTSNRVAANLGIFPRIVAAEKAAHRQYQAFSWLINGALGLQIIFAAALTALGAGNGPRSAVTAFGALNTILAGLLTFVKGSGLPNRIKYYENEWTKVREYIEQRERDFAHVTAFDHDLHLLDEIATIERMYETVRRDIEVNTPDSYISTTKQSGVGVAPGPSLARNFSTYGEKAQERLSHYQDSAKNRYSQLQSSIDSRLRDSQNMASGGLQDARNYVDTRYRTTSQQLLDEKARVGSNVQHSVNQVQAEADAQIRQIQETTDAKVKEIQGTVKQSEDKVKSMEAKAIAATEKAAEKVLNFIHHRKEGQ